MRTRPPAPDADPRSLQEKKLSELTVAEFTLVCLNIAAAVSVLALCFLAPPVGLLGLLLAGVVFGLRRLAAPRPYRTRSGRAS